jgi:protein-disulfide isomerase
VAGVLVVQAGLFGWMAVAGVFGPADGSLWSAGLLAGLFLATGSLVFLLKTRLKEGSEAEQAEAAANRVKYNPSVFTHLLLQQPQADCTPFEKELLIGKPEAPVTLTMAASLGCSPCKEGFEKASQLVRMYPEQVNLTVRFSVPKQSNGSGADPGRYLLAVWLHRINGTKHSSKDSEHLIRDWFELADMNAFREKYPLPVNGQNKELDTLAVQHSGWFEKADIKGTPTFFVNGYPLPGQYRVEDLRYLVSGFNDLTPDVRANIKQAAPKQNH